MRLSQAAQYAVLAMVQLSHDPKSPPVSCSHLAKLGDMPERFLLQVLRNLVTAGLLKSTRGCDGGYRLAKPLTKTTLAEVVEAIDGPLVAYEPTALRALNGSALAVQGALQDGVQLYRGVLNRVKLSQLVAH